MQCHCARAWVLAHEFAAATNGDLRRRFILTHHRASAVLHRDATFPNRGAKWRSSRIVSLQAAQASIGGRCQSLCTPESARCPSRATWAQGRRNSRTRPASGASSQARTDGPPSSIQRGDLHLAAPSEVGYLRAWATSGKRSQEATRRPLLPARRHAMRRSIAGWLLLVTSTAICCAGCAPVISVGTTLRSTDLRAGSALSTGISLAAELDVFSQARPQAVSTPITTSTETSSRHELSSRTLRLGIVAELGRFFEVSNPYLDLRLVSSVDLAALIPAIAERLVLRIGVDVAALTTLPDSNTPFWESSGTTRIGPGAHLDIGVLEQGNVTIVATVGMTLLQWTGDYAQTSVHVGLRAEMQ